MAIEIKEYIDSDTIIEEVRLVANELLYHPATQILNFKVDLFSKHSAPPIKPNIISGNLIVSDATNLEEVVDNAIKFKIDSVIGKTEEECIEHNKSVSSWIDIWDISYLNFIPYDEPEPAEEDPYVTAAKIMLGEE